MLCYNISLSDYFNSHMLISISAPISLMKCSANICCQTCNDHELIQGQCGGQTGKNSQNACDTDLLDLGSDGPSSAGQ